MEPFDVLHKPSEVGAIDNPEARKLESYPLFDWLRFLLASAVALTHVGLMGWEPAGGLAVRVFFALSGWLIGGILLNTAPKELPRFYFNRATRIWVPYFCTIIALYLTSAAHDQITGRWLEFLLYDCTFTHNWFSLLPDAQTAIEQMPLMGTGNHFWSISVEEQFYLAAPALILMLRFGKTTLFWLATSVAFLLLELPDFATISLGVSAAALKRDYGSWHLARGAVVCIFLVAALAAILTANEAYYQTASPFFSIAVVLLAARPAHRSQFGMFLGGVSYPMYLNHWMGVFAINGIVKHLGYLPSHIAHGLLSYAAGVLAGVMAYLLVDRNVLAQRSRFYSYRLGLAMGLTAYLLVGCGLIVGLAWRSAFT